MFDCLKTLVAHIQGTILCNEALLYTSRNWCHHFHYVLTNGTGNEFIDANSSPLMALLKDLLTTLVDLGPEAVHWFLFMREAHDDLCLVISQLKVIRLFTRTIARY
jgi:hypothetical protein